MDILNYINEYQVLLSQEHNPILNKTKTIYHDNRFDSYVDMVVLLDNIYNISDKATEMSVIIGFDSASRVLGIVQLSLGTEEECYTRNKEIFTILLLMGACKCILFHNHPNGICEPSEEDCDILERLESGGNILDIEIEEDIIVTRDAICLIKGGEKRERSAREEEYY